MTVKELYEFAEKHNVLDAKLWIPKYMEDDDAMYEQVRRAIVRVSLDEPNGIIQLRTS